MLLSSLRNYDGDAVVKCFAEVVTGPQIAHSIYGNPSPIPG